MLKKPVIVLTIMAIIAAVLAKYKAPIDQLQKTIVGETLVDLDAERTDIRTQETNFGNLVADAMLAKASTATPFFRKGRISSTPVL